MSLESGSTSGEQPKNIPKSETDDESRLSGVEPSVETLEGLRILIEQKLDIYQRAYTNLETDIKDGLIKNRAEIRKRKAWNRLTNAREQIVDLLQAYSLDFGEDEAYSRLRTTLLRLEKDTGDLNGRVSGTRKTSSEPRKNDSVGEPSGKTKTTTENSTIVNDSEKNNRNGDISVDDVKNHPPEILDLFIKLVSKINSELSKDLSTDDLFSLLNELIEGYNHIFVRLLDKDLGKYRKDRDYFEIKDYVESIPKKAQIEIETRLLEKLRKETLITEIEAELSSSITSTDETGAYNERKLALGKLTILKQQFTEKFETRIIPGTQVDHWYHDLQNRIDLKLSEYQRDISNHENRPLSKHETDRLLTKSSIEKFLIRRGIPLREDKPEFSDIDKYLEVIHQEIQKVTITTLWNQLLDRSGNGTPRTVSYKIEPMTGPAQEVHLLESQLIYTVEKDQAVYNLESFFDQFEFYFDNPNEAKKAKHMAERMKEQVNQISLWHNRAFVRRKNESNAGPEGAFKALSELAERPGLSPNIEQLFTFSAEQSESEKRFADAIEYSMSIWSVMSLKLHERKRLWPHIDPRIKAKYFGKEKGKEKREDRDLEFKVKDEYNILPRYKSTTDKREKMVGEIIQDLVGMGLTESQAQLAYHIGETYRIGSGLEAFWDVSYEEPSSSSKEFNVKVAAIEGEPKAANIGLYVESAWSNPVRPDFNTVYKDYLVHGYIPFNRALQFTHNFRVGGDKLAISEFGDGRASLAEILAVKGAIKTVNWQTASSSPDKIIQAAANQTVNFWWPSASVSKAVKPEHSFFLDVLNIPLSTTALLDREDEIQPLRYKFGSSGGFIRFLTNLVTKFKVTPSLATHEVYGFKSDSTPISGERNQHLRNLYKNLRDYWVSAFDADSKRYPLDSIRAMRYMFSRDDRPNGYVNEKIGRTLTQLMTESNDPAKTGSIGDQVKTWKEWLTGYITYDLLMRSVYYLLQPDFRNVEEIKEQVGDKSQITTKRLNQVYHSLDFSNFENLLTKTVGGAQLINASELMYVINQSVLLHGQFPEETKKIAEAGYKLFADGEARDYAGVLFTHRDLLRLAQEFNLGEGYHYRVQTDTNKRKFMQLERDKHIKPTIQWLSDRLVLLSYLFKRDQLKLQK